MNMHKNARLTAHSRAELVHRVDARQRVGIVAAALGVSIRTVYKWLVRFRTEGTAGLVDRSSRPHQINRPTPGQTVESIIALRRQRFTSKHIALARGSR